MSSEVEQRLARIQRLIEAMTPAERSAAATVYASVNATFALHGSDDAIAGAQVLGECIDLILIADRDERRVAERQAL